MTTEAASGHTKFVDRVAAGIRDLHPGYFAFVMATGIISTGAFLLGPSWLSRALLVIASIGFAALVVPLVISLAPLRVVEVSAAQSVNHPRKPALSIYVLLICVGDVKTELR